MRKLHYLVGLPTGCGAGGQLVSWAAGGPLGPSSSRCTQRGSGRCSLDSRENARMFVLSAKDIFSRREKVLCDGKSPSATSTPCCEVEYSWTGVSCAYVLHVKRFFRCDAQDDRGVAGSCAVWASPGRMGEDGSQVSSSSLDKFTFEVAISHSLRVALRPG